MERNERQPIFQRNIAEGKQGKFLISFKGASGGGEKERRVEILLLGWVVCEGDSFGDIALQAFYTGLEKCLLVLIEVGEWVLCLFSSSSLFLSANNRMLRCENIRLALQERRRNHSQSPWQFPRHLEYQEDRRKLG